MFFNLGGSGFPRSHFDDMDDENQQIDNNEYYNILEVNKSATQQQIKKSYQKLIKIHHPDKNNGNSQKFNKIQQAYKTLRDPQKRKQYDQSGKNTHKSSNHQSDFLSMFLNQGMSSGLSRKKQLPKVQATKKPLQLTLQNIYTGNTLKIPHKRTRICDKCNGKGGQNVQKCKTCKGKGQVIQMYQMGPGMFQQVQKACDKCSGEGQIIPQNNRCKACKGKKTVEKEKTIQVPIEKGIPQNYPIKITGQGHQIPQALPGDLIFITKQQKHDKYTRIGADLFLTKKITLFEALTGLQFKIKHLDGIEYKIQTSKGEVISDEMKKTIKGLGMPFYKNPSLHGNLIIQFFVTMPKKDELSKQQLNSLVSLLPGTVNPRPQGQYQMFQDFDPDTANPNQEGGKKPADQYDQNDRQEGGYSCQH